MPPRRKLSALVQFIQWKETHMEPNIWHSSKAVQILDSMWVSFHCINCTNALIFLRGGIAFTGSKGCLTLDFGGLQEAGMMAAMRHPNVVMYLGVCLQPPAVVTEYCARGSLNDVLKKCLAKPELTVQLDWVRRLGMALDAAKGMNYLHSSDPPVIHRDLKSPNLLVDKHWRVKVRRRSCTRDPVLMYASTWQPVGYS